MPVKKKFNYTKEQLLEILKEEYEKNPNTKCQDFKVVNGLPNYNDYNKTFGSFSEALVIAGIKTGNRRAKNINKEDIKDSLKKYYEENKRTPSMQEFINYSGYTRRNLEYHFGNKSFYENLLNECNIKQTQSIIGIKSDDEMLLNEIKRFVKEFGRVPIQKDFENLKGYPSRKTFSNHFGKFNNAIRLAGFEPVNKDIAEKHEYYYDENTRADMIIFLKEYYQEHGKVPTTKELDENKCKYNRTNFRYVFGNYTNAVKEAGLQPNSVLKHDDGFLRSEFERFIKENGRTPYLHEFNNSEYPSFWCYQNRFGSWNKMFIAYGYEPNDSNRKFYMEDGELCWSAYEFDISKWLKEHNIKYDRDVKYKEIDNDYKGKMDCDYKIYYNNKIWYVEMAGYVPRKGQPFEKWTPDEKNYIFKLKYKKKLLDRNKLNYLIIYPSHIKEKTLEEIFKPILG
jgi:sulfur relay (sulfurtransferase) DsrC/TusE family protein